MTGMITYGLLRFMGEERAEAVLLNTEKALASRIIASVAPFTLTRFAVTIPAL